MLKTFVENFLIENECPVDYVGFQILSAVLCEACGNLGEVKTNLKSIYIAAGQKLHMSRLSIERDLRTLIAKWSPSKKFQELFPETPTNAKLVMTLAYKVQRPNSSVYDIYLLP